MKFRRPRNPHVDIASNPLSDAYSDGIDALINKLKKLPRYARTKARTGILVNNIDNHDFDTEYEILAGDVVLVALPRQLLEPLVEAQSDNRVDTTNIDVPDKESGEK